MIKFPNRLQIKAPSVNAGFTLLEILIATAIIIVVSGGIATVFIDVFSTGTFLRESFFAEREAALALREAVQEIRAATNSNTGAYLIEKAEPFSFAFYANVDKDTARERVHYFLSGTSLKKSVIKPAGSPLTYATTTAQESLKTVLSNVVASSTLPLFSYFGKEYWGTTSPMVMPVNIPDVRLVRLRFIIRGNEANNVPEFITGSEVEIRNLKYVE